VLMRKRRRKSLVSTNHPPGPALARDGGDRDHRRSRIICHPVDVHDPTGHSDLFGRIGTAAARPITTPTDTALR